MRDRQVIEREMFRAREDLEDRLAELRHVVQEKVDVKARARIALEKGKMRASDATRGARELAKKGSDRAYFTYLKAKDRPVLTASIFGGILAAGALIFIGRRRDWW